MDRRGFAAIAFTAFAAAVFFAGMSIGVQAQDLSKTGDGNSMATMPIEAVLKENTEALMAIPGVVGIGQGECAGEPCIKVYVTEKTRELVERIPAKIESYSVVVEESGAFRAL